MEGDDSNYKKIELHVLQLWSGRVDLLRLLGHLMPVLLESQRGSVYRAT